MITLSASAETTSESTLELANEAVHLVWKRLADGWRLVSFQARSGDAWRPLPGPSGRHTVLHVDRKPAANLVELDREGIAYPFFPDEAEPVEADGVLRFRRKLEPGELVSEWSLDPDHPSDVRVRLSFTASRAGWFALASPTAAVFEPGGIAWGMVPGNWYGTGVQANFELSPGYSQGIPDRPFLVGERNTMTPCALLSTRDGLTLAVIVEPGTAADPWEHDKSTRERQHIGLSTRDRYEQLTPVAYAPVLGGEGSRVEAGQRLEFAFRYALQVAPWFEVFRHAARDVYRFPDLLALQHSRESLSTRVARLHALLCDETKSGWRTRRLHGKEIGANGAKTSDVGALWMLARAGGHAALAGRLPLIRNYKLAQQQMGPGFFQHAATGEYPEEQGFAAERGNWIEPLFTTYYTLQDLGNVALFEPDDEEVRGRIRLAAERLLGWQKPDGSWDVAYDRVSHRPVFAHLRDLRPTWYGLLVAWRILGEAHYLEAARRGADWYLSEAVERGHYLGACGDALNIWDFTTVFGSQALLDLFAATGELRYRDAAIEVAKVYATTIYTHPIPTAAVKRADGVERRDWELTQAGLGVEHIRGTAMGGPILLSSHAGLFVRMHELTGDPLFLEMARAAARGRHHFVNEETGLSVYYWHALDRVGAAATLFPWHAEWQVGWITDYLLAEAHLRSGGAIAFPAGFATPKVGSHVAYGFAPGKLYGRAATLRMRAGEVSCGNPNAEHFTALGGEGSLFVVVLNQWPHPQEIALRVGRGWRQGSAVDPVWSACERLAGDLAFADARTGEACFRLPAWGLGVVRITAV